MAFVSNRDRHAAPVRVLGTVGRVRIGIRQRGPPGGDHPLPARARDDNSRDHTESGRDDADRGRDLTSPRRGRLVSWTTDAIGADGGPGPEPRQDATTFVAELGAGAVLALALRTTHRTPLPRRQVHWSRSAPTLAPRE